MVEPVHDDDSLAGSPSPLYPQPETLIGQRLGGRFTIERLLGRGGMGAVYEARTNEGGAVALKVIRPEVYERVGQDAVRRFVREVKAVEQINSPYVTRVIDAGTDFERGVPYLVMELLHGRDLSRLLRERGPLEASGAVPMFVQACAGIAAAHERGIIHRDLKPANLFVHDLPDRGVITKVCDFGVAKHTSGLDEGTDLTQSGGVLGSPMYMSPEQARNSKTVDHRTDIFSLAISLYEALSGIRPWQGGSVGELVLAMWSTEPRPLTSAAPWIDPRLAGVIHKALRRLPEQRFATAADFGAALAELESGPLTLDSLRAVSDEQKSVVTAGGGSSSVWSDTAVAPTLQGERFPSPSAETPISPSSGTRGAPRSARAGGFAVVAVAVAALGIGWVVRSRPPAKWWTAARATIAVPITTGDTRSSRHACPPWLPGALSNGMTAQLEAGGKVRAIGPRQLAGLADASPANAHVLRTAFGADAVVEATCEASGRDAVRVNLRVVSTSEPERVLASFHVSGSATTPGELVTQVTDEMRAKLGLEEPPPNEVKREVKALPASPDNVQAYVEGMAKLDAFDAASARESLSKVTAAEPGFAPAHAALAEAFAYLGQQKDAARESALAVANASALPNEERLVAEGDAAAATYSYAQAIETYRAIVKVFPDRTDVALKLVQIYLKAGRARDARENIQALLARTDGTTTDPRVQGALASVQVLLGDYTTAGDSARAAQALAHADGMKVVEAQSMVSECNALTSTTDLDGAEKACAEAMKQEEALGDKAALVSVLARFGYVYALRGEYEKSKEMTARALAIASEIGNKSLQATALLMRANITKRQGDLESTLTDARAALPLADDSGNAYLEASARTMLAGTLLDKGVIDEAGRIYEDDLALCRATGNEVSAAVVLQNLATYWLLKGNIARGRESAAEALDKQRALGDELDEPWSLDEVGELEVEAGDPAAARGHFEEAIVLRTKLKLPTTSSREDLAEALLGLGDLDGALREVTVAVDAFHAAGSRNGEVEGLFRLARVQLARGDVAKALETATASVALSHEVGESTDTVEPVRVRALFLAGHVSEAMAAGAKVSEDEVTAQRDMRLVMDELWLRQGQRDRAVHDLQALASEAHAAGHGRVENAANALIAGKWDEGYR